MIGVFGGSFDPIHFGHLLAAQTCIEQLSLKKLLFVPCHQHPFGKQFSASNQQRLDMLQRAIADNQLLAIDDRELHSEQTSYTFDTLNALAQDYPEQKLAFIIGIDAFANLPSWHRWQEILELAHIIVLPRPGFILPESGELYDYLCQHYCVDPKTLADSTSKIVIIDAPLLEISSSEIRDMFAKKQNPRYLLPNKVLNYIKEQHIYSI